MREKPIVLVTGATGFLGGAVARRLFAEGWRVRATGRQERAGAALAAEGIPFTSCDLAESPDLLAKLTAGCIHVVHCAALSSPWGRRRDFQQANVIATRNVIAACQAAGVQRLVAISSPSVSFIYGSQLNIGEDAPWVDPAANHYIATKRIAERAVLTAGLPCVVLRPKALFGPGDTTLIPRVLKVAARGRFPLFGPDCLLDLTWIGDAVDAVLLALQADDRCHGKVYHITSGAPLSRQQVLKTLFAACGLQVRLRRMPLPAALALGSALEGISRLTTMGGWEPPLTRYSVGALGYGQTLDISAARRDLGYAPLTDIPARLQECGLAWRKRHSPI